MNFRFWANNKKAVSQLSRKNRWSVSASPSRRCRCSAKLSVYWTISQSLPQSFTAELTARKQQYAYYRDNLLTFRVDITRKSLDELCTISAAGDAPKDALSLTKTAEYQIPVISNGIGENAFYGYTDKPKITEPAVTVAARGTIGYAEYRDYPYYPIIRLLSLIPKKIQLFLRQNTFIIACKGKNTMFH